MDSELYINYPLGTRILNCIYDRIDTGKNIRPEGMLIMADPDNGKSFILRKIYKDLQPNVCDPEEIRQIPFVLVQAPVNACRSDLFRSMAKALFIPDAPQLSADKLRGRVRQAMVDAKVRALGVDELHHLVAGGVSKTRAVLDDLKTFSNELQIPIIAAGTSRAYLAIRDDDQYLSRMPPILLPRWPYDGTYIGLLTALEEGLHAPKAALANPQISELIWKHSKGLIGKTVRIAAGALGFAKAEGSESITENNINQAGFSDLPWYQPGQ